MQNATIHALLEEETFLETKMFTLTFPTSASNSSWTIDRWLFLEAKNTVTVIFCKNYVS